METAPPMNFSDEDLALSWRQEREVWGQTMHGFTKEAATGLLIVQTTIPDIGLRYVRGRRVLKLRHKTMLGGEYFLPAGLSYCGGRLP